ncbi:MAG TPA: hypothetical protein VMV18_10490, partial [bacterium]|nr:hypothetical protein [bacterium]
AIAGATPSLVTSFRAALRRSAILGAVSAVRFFAVIAGTIACVFPGVLALGMFSQAPHLVMAEDLGVSGSLVRSARLSTQAARGTMAATLLAIAMMLVGFVELAMTVELALFLAGAIAPAFPVAWAQRPETAWILLALTVVLAAPPVSAASALALLDARIRAEGLDLELRSELLAGEPLSFAPVEDPA